MWQEETKPDRQKLRKRVLHLKFMFIQKIVKLEFPILYVNCKKVQREEFVDKRVHYMKR